MSEESTHKERGPETPEEVEARRKLQAQAFGHLPDIETKASEQSIRTVSVRYTSTQKEDWDRTAQSFGVTVPELARQLLDEKAARTLECAHLTRVSFAWTTLCLDCGISIP